MNKQATGRELQIAHNHKEKDLASFKMKELQGESMLREMKLGSGRRDLDARWVGQDGDGSVRFRAGGSGMREEPGFRVATTNHSPSVSDVGEKAATP